MSATRKIFEDPSRRRWRWTVATFGLFLAVGLGLAAVFVSDLMVNPPLPSLQQAARRRHSILETEPAVVPPALPATRPPRSPRPLSLGAVGLARLPKKGETLALGFLVQSDPRSLAAFEQHAERIDAVVPDWLTLTGPGPEVQVDVDASVAASLRRRSVTVLPRLSNVAGDSWHVADLEQLLASAKGSRAAAERVAQVADELGVGGINLDLELLPRTDREPLSRFVRLLAERLHQRGKLLTVDVTPNDPTFDLPVIGRVADGVILMMYDQHYPSAEPGPVAGEEWFEESLDAALEQLPPSKLVVALGNYGYDWTRGERAPARTLTYDDVMALANDLQAEPEMRGRERNPHFTYEDDEGALHDVWFLDALTAWNETVLAHRRHVAGLGLWRLGSEAPQTWAVIDGGLAEARALAAVPALERIEYPASGELLRIESVPHGGQVDLSLDGDLVDYARYLVTPAGYTVARVGAEMPPKTLVLTFDDGPDPVWTPQVLATLDRLHVPAAFFVVGDQALRHPELVRAEAERGMLIGNHSYLHPNIATISPARLRAELNSTQRLIESITHRRTVLFRAPYDTDSRPRDTRELAALEGASELGYVIASANIFGNDWERPGAEAIAATVERLAAEPDSHVIILHDAGGDRSQTVAALDRIVPELRARGFRFVSLEEASGIPRDLLSPPLPASERLLVGATSLLTALGHYGWTAVVVLFALTTGLSLVRILLLGSLVLGGARRARHRVPEEPTFPPLTVVVPAFNEERVIAKTLASVLASRYPELEVLVIDDGSTDGTAAVVAAIAAAEPRLRLISTVNGGKSAALNLGFREARTSIVVTIDGDTLLDAGALERLALPFADERIDAVCGNVEVGNVRNALTAFQALEYITTQNFDRRAFEILNCITVVPGATGAWRRDRVLALGGYQQDTLTEDADITLRLLRAGGRIVYEPEARSKTEAPETMAALARQRFRWSYGTFQCLWKHRSALFHGSLGWVGLPNLFLFQIFFPILSPIGDLVFLLALLRGDLRAVASGYVLFLLMDLAGSLLAFTLERRPRRLMWLILVQRFFYRQFMYVVTFRSLLATLRGRRHGWNKLQRRGSVPQQA